MSYEPLHHKYRPQTFADLVGQEAIATTLINAIRTERIAPAYLFTGPRGTGKTSSARILAKSLNCKKQDKPTESPCGVCEVCISITSGSALDVIEIDAASNTGVDNIREIIERAQFAPVQCRNKVYVIDEVHMLSNAAFNALLKTLEEPPKHVVFVLATTDPQRVLPTIISRCQRFDFRRIPLEAMVSHLSVIATNENINITPDAITLVAQVAQGGLRDAESLLDQLSLLSGQVSVERVWDLVGAVPERDLMALAKAIASDESEAVLDHCRRLMDKGREPLVVLQNLAGFYRDLLIAKTAPTRNDLVAVTPPTWKQLCEFAQQLEVSSILLGSQHLKNSEAQIKNTTQPRLWLEVTLLGLLPSSSVTQTVGLATGEAKSSVTVAQSRSPIPERSLPRNPVQNGTSPEPSQAREQTQQPPSSAPENSTPNPSPLPNQVSPVRSPVSHEQPEPTSAVSDSTSSETRHSAVDDQSVGLEQVWQQVLNHIKLFGTRELLRQHCSLVAFEGQVATIGVSSKGLLKLAQSKLPEVEIAFQAVYNVKVRVNIHLLNSIASNSAVTQASVSEVTPSASEEQLTPQSTRRQPIDHATISRSPTNSPPAFAGGSVPSETQENVTRTQEDKTQSFSSPRQSNASIAPSSFRGITSEEIPVTALGSVHSVPFTKQDTVASGEQLSNTSHYSLNPSPTSPSSPALDWDADEVERAIGSLKQFFEGEIIDLADDSHSNEPMMPEVSQKLDWAGTANTYSLQSSETKTSGNMEADSPL
ncbi:MAG: DNA polymerase III subunit gamma/tau, partial [Coleofasciculus sp. S288]|nr:DNA polymerase III subunit gamma/tau [Coleofasciculus sp. S288]